MKETVGLPAKADILNIVYSALKDFSPLHLFADEMMMRRLIKKYSRPV